MDETEIKHIVEAALLAAGRPLSLERLQELFATKGGGPERATIKQVLDTLANDYQGRGIELKEVSSGYRIQIRRTMTDWLLPLWEERAPRYTRALLETLALVAYRQPITRAEIEEVRGVVVSTNIIRTLLERSWVRVVGHRDVPGKPAMFGTTREFLDYFGLKKLDELPTLAEIKDGLPELSPQTDLIESLEEQARLVELGPPDAADSLTEARPIDLASDLDAAALGAISEPDSGAAADEESVIAENLLESGGVDFAGAPLDGEDGDEAAVDRDADVIPLRAAPSRADGE
ncbi:MAG TPA: SMC-Scp complex subunit ScpB [Gammaproteobacteria bacterium]|nr:SMC-Scp complex subunit ScpB [Gammaproteobacteria bacterium]